MPRIPIFRLGRSAEEPLPPQLGSYTPQLTLEGLQLGVDNLRHDVHLSPKFVEQARLQIARSSPPRRHGRPSRRNADRPSGQYFIGSTPLRKPSRPRRARRNSNRCWPTCMWRRLNRAKAAENLSVDVLARVAIIKFLRIELNSQFAQVLERCRMMLKQLRRRAPAEGPRVSRAGGTVSRWRRKSSCAKPGRNCSAPCARSRKKPWPACAARCLATAAKCEYKLFLNPLIFTEDGRDTYLNAEHYVMLGNFDRDPDRFSNVRRDCLRIPALAESGPGSRGRRRGRWLAQRPGKRPGTGGRGPAPTKARHEGRRPKARLAAWVECWSAKSSWTT